MKTLILIIALLFNSTFKTTFDIAPNPIAAKGIMSHKECKIQMVSELVEVELYKDSAFVTCHFKMENKGDKTNLEIGFPVMEFQYWSFGGYTPQDKSRFTITVDDQEITKNHIKVPQELQKLYDTYMDSYSKDLGISGDVISEFSDKVENGSFPWYVWDATFDEGEQKDIKVSYKLPSGIGYGAHYRYFNYILHTGSGWYGDIKKADIILRLHDINFDLIEKISPKGNIVNKSDKTISWQFLDIEPSKDDDIYIQYYVPKERRKYYRYQKAKKRKLEKKKK